MIEWRDKILSDPTLLDRYSFYKNRLIAQIEAINDPKDLKALSELLMDKELMRKIYKITRRS